jgi:hypothetical protein
MLVNRSLYKVFSRDEGPTLDYIQLRIRYTVKYKKC